MAITDKINIDFQVLPTGNPKVLAVMDNSTWGIIVDKTAIIEITPPNKDLPITHYFDKGKINVFNSSNLLLSKIGLYNDMVDGLYKIVVKGSPDSNCKERYFLKDDQTKMELYRIYAKLGAEDSTENRKAKEAVYEAEMYIRAANACIALGKLRKGTMFLKRAMDFIKGYNNCENC